MLPSLDPVLPTLSQFLVLGELPSQKKSHSAYCHCPQGPVNCAKPPTNCQQSPQALVYNTPWTLCLETVWVHETSWYSDIQEKSHDSPQTPLIIVWTCLKAQPVFHCKFAVWMSPQLILVFSTSHFSLFFSPILWAHISLKFQCQEQFCFCKFIL